MQPKILKDSHDLGETEVANGHSFIYSFIHEQNPWRIGFEKPRKQTI